MKNLFALIFPTVILLFGCQKTESAREDEAVSVNPLFSVATDSGLAYVDIERLSFLRDSNFALYEQSKRRGKYRQAFQYNGQYRLYNDSILQAQRERELAEVRVGFDHEKLIEERDRFPPKKANGCWMKWNSFIPVLLRI